MHALFIGHTYIDVTIVTGHVPVGDEKGVASEYAVSFGGNAVTAAFCCAKLGIKPDLIATGADDWLGRMFWDMARKYELELHVRKVRRSSLSFVMPHAGERAILRARDDKYLHPAVTRSILMVTNPTPPFITPAPVVKPAFSRRSTAAACASTPTRCWPSSTSPSCRSAFASS
jgi:hypothetical protein